MVRFVYHQSLEEVDSELLALDKVEDGARSADDNMLIDLLAATDNVGNGNSDGEILSTVLFTLIVGKGLDELFHALETVSINNGKQNKHGTFYLAASTVINDIH